MKTIQEIIELSAQFLSSKGVENSRRFVEDLLAHLLKMKRIDLYLQFDRPLEEKELSLFRGWVKRASMGEPFEYIVGSISFFNCTYHIDSRCLIPRPETEILMELIVQKIKGRVVWDLCSGPGTIGIALKKALPHLEVTLSDLSAAALELAQENSRLNQTEVEILQGDLFHPFRGHKADVIVCNPPYISEKEYFEIDPSVRDFEPKMALVGGVKGTEFYQRLANELPLFLVDGGQVFLEIGANQGEAVKEIFDAPIWAKRELIQDWSGKNRFFFLEKQ